MSLARPAFAEEDRAAVWLATIAGPAVADLTVADSRIVPPKPTPWNDHELDPVWCARITSPGAEAGYLMWETKAEGRLLEFALPKLGSVPGEHQLAAVPNLQQFGVSGVTAPQVCSGCVPTAAANLVAYWAARGFPKWGGAGESRALNEDELRAVAVRLRKLLKMSEIPDDLGYTDDHRPLSGAMPADLAKALQVDAAAHGVQAVIAFAPFAAETFRSEIDAGRPVLLTCRVRLPQKPELSWGHELTGVAWAEVGGALFVGVRDNFYPAQGIETRWVRAEVFESMITARPE